MDDPVTIMIDNEDFAALLAINASLVDESWPNSGHNGSFSVPQGQKDTSWTWALEFDGISVSLVGVTPPSEYNQTILLIAPDDADKPYGLQQYTYPFGSHLFTSGNAWSSEKRLLGLSQASGISIDYALVTAVPKFSGTGTGAASPQLHSFSANVSSHANTTHKSSNIGDSFTFQFTGTSLLISGITPGIGGSDADWLLQMEFTVDGNANTNVITSGRNDVVSPHFVYFNATFDAGVRSHTLVAKALNIAGNSTACRAYRLYHVPAVICDDCGQAQISSCVGYYGGTTGSIRSQYDWGTPQIGWSDPPECFVSSATSPMRERNAGTKREPLSENENTLAERRNDLAAEIQQLQEARPSEEDGQTMDERSRALQAQMDALTHHLVPPSYAEI
ncbi:hypothetical protein C8R47DRAFT_1227245 [Mycena vitilis]|nr:hypothetical protein C8R47DRAFT_1227245 [Mycena vitilis]